MGEVRQARKTVTDPLEGKVLCLLQRHSEEILRYNCDRDRIYLSI